MLKIQIESGCAVIETIWGPFTNRKHRIESTIEIIVDVFRTVDEPFIMHYNNEFYVYKGYYSFKEYAGSHYLISFEEFEKHVKIMSFDADYEDEAD